MAISDCASADEVLTAIPCLNCMSEVELWALLAVIFSAAQGQTEADMLTGAAKYRDLSDLEFLRGLVATLPDAWLANVDFTAIDASIKTIRQRGEQEVKAMLLWTWCSYFGTV